MGGTSAAGGKPFMPQNYLPEGFSKVWRWYSLEKNIIKTKNFLIQPTNSSEDPIIVE